MECDSQPGCLGLASTGELPGKEVRASLAMQVGCLDVTGFSKSFLSRVQPLKDENAQMFSVL